MQMSGISTGAVGTIGGVWSASLPAVERHQHHHVSYNRRHTVA